MKCITLTVYVADDSDAERVRQNLWDDARMVWEDNPRTVVLGCRIRTMNKQDHELLAERTDSFQH